MYLKILTLSYYELMRKVKEHEEKYLVIGDFVLDKVFEKIKEIIRIEKFDDTKTLIATDDKLPDDITLKNVVILMKCAIKDGDQFFAQLFLEEAFYDK